MTNTDTGIVATGAAACTACAAAIGISPTFQPIIGALVAIVGHAILRALLIHFKRPDSPSPPDSKP